MDHPQYNSPQQQAIFPVPVPDLLPYQPGLLERIRSELFQFAKETAKRLFLGIFKGIFLGFFLGFLAGIGVFLLLRYFQLLPSPLWVSYYIFFGVLAGIPWGIYICFSRILEKSLTAIDSTVQTIGEYLLGLLKEKVSERAITLAEATLQLDQTLVSQFQLKARKGRFLGIFRAEGFVYLFLKALIKSLLNRLPLVGKLITAQSIIAYGLSEGFTLLKKRVVNYLLFYFLVFLGITSALILVIWQIPWLVMLSMK